MPEKKKQHYVPKFYMRLFANQQDVFSVLNISTRKIFQNVPYDSQCYRDYFYGKDGIWENRLSSMESVWANTIQRILGKKPLISEDIVALKQFALYQRQRTMAEMNHSKQIRKELLIEYLETICADKGWQFEEGIIEELCEQRANESIAPAQTLQMAERHLKIIEDLSIVIIEYDTKLELISSDVPVISINPFHQLSIGYGCMGLIMLFPISPHHLVVLYDQKMYPKFKGQTYLKMSNETEVFNLNTLQLISAEKILFAREKTAFSVANAKNWSTRERNRKATDVHALGSGTQKLIGISLRKAILDCTFSFGKVHPNFDKIPFSCKEAVPRVWEKGWEDKLNMKADMMAQIAGYQPNMLKDIGLTKKEFRQGYEKMAKAARWYWRNI